MVEHLIYRYDGNFVGHMIFLAFIIVLNLL